MSCMSCKMSSEWWLRMIDIILAGDRISRDWHLISPVTGKIFRGTDGWLIGYTPIEAINLHLKYGWEIVQSDIDLHWIKDRPMDGVHPDPTPEERPDLYEEVGLPVSDQWHCGEDGGEVVL